MTPPEALAALLAIPMALLPFAFGFAAGMAYVLRSYWRQRPTDRYTSWLIAENAKLREQCRLLKSFQTYRREPDE